MAGMHEILIVNIGLIDVYILIFVARDIPGYLVGIGQNIDGLFDYFGNKFRFLFSSDEIVLNCGKEDHVLFNLLHTRMLLFPLF